jgi:outer membrane PBP1 activator LpoA protein
MGLPALKSVQRLVAAMAILWLGACAAPPGIVETTPDEASQARQALATGNFNEAARLWQEAALVSVGPERQDYQLRAAEAWWRAGESDRTRSQLSQVDEQQLIRTGLARYGLLYAEISLAGADAASAEFYLQLAAGNLAADQQSRYRRLLERTLRLQTDPASYALATAGSALRSRTTYDVHQGVAILQLLEDVPSGKLRDLSPETAESFGLGGWPELAALIRGTLINGNPSGEMAAIWANKHPRHEVTESGFIELVARYRQLFSLPVNIAVLLPSRGGLAGAGKAIRDGLISAYLDKPEDVNLRFYATTEDPQSAVSAYYQAVRDDAQWIIGPLRRESVQALAELSGLGLPVLALNNFTVSEPSRQGNHLLFSLSLSQEQEARSIARTALRTGKSKAIMMTSNSPWGMRMESAFGEEFVTGGGTIVANAQFSPAGSDHSTLLTDLLKIDESNERKNRVQATLGLTLNFEPTRRDDFDLIFLAANPEQGRQIRPQLRFHEAGDIPVFAMGRIFADAENRTANQDLNGIYFPSTHWQMNRLQTASNTELASLRGGNLGSLHALGKDAWNLLPWLPLMQKDPDLNFPGSVGSLFMSPGGQLLRDPAWAQFSRGRPVPVTWPDPED